MSKKLTITVPDEVFAQAQQIASTTQHPVEQVVSNMLTRSLMTFPQNAQRERMLQEVEAYEQLHSQLVQQHLGEYVAIFQGKLVDHDHDPAALLARVRAAYPGQSVLRRLVEKKPSKELVFRSPRLS